MHEASSSPLTDIAAFRRVEATIVEDAISRTIALPVQARFDEFAPPDCVAYDLRLKGGAGFRSRLSPTQRYGGRIRC